MLERVGAAFLQAAALLGAAERESELHQVHTSEHEMALDADALAPAAVEQHDLAAGGQVLGVALKYHCPRSTSLGFPSATTCWPVSFGDSAAGRSPTSTGRGSLPVRTLAAAFTGCTWATGRRGAGRTRTGGAAESLAMVWCRQWNRWVRTRERGA